MAVTAPPSSRVRADVVAGLHEPITALVHNIDAVEVAVRVHLDMPGATLTPGLRRALGRLLAARNSYLDPLVRAAEEGR